MINQILSGVEPALLKSHTIKQLLEIIVGNTKAKEMLAEFAYDSEVDTMRADVALKGFCSDNEMGNNHGYVVCTDGLSKLIDGMVADFEAIGGKILERHFVKHLNKDTLELDVRVGKKTEAVEKKFIAKKGIILALHHEALCELGALRGCEALRRVKMRPLLRTYAVFKDKDLVGIPRFVTSGSNRYFIPMNGVGSVAMISYTDGDSAEKYLKILDEKGEKTLGNVIISEMRKMFPDRKISDPTFFKAHPWYSGCSYWLPGDYHVAEASKEAHRPFGSDVAVYVCGESFSLRQAWMEGALEHAESLLTML
jgi:hypothetical protein